MTTVLYGGAFASRHVLTGLDKSREEKERLADEDVAALVSQICSPFTIDEIYRYIRAGLFHHILSDLTHGTYSRSFQFTTVRLPYFCKNFNRLKTAESQQLDVHVQALLGFVGQIISDAKMDETSRLGRGWLDNGRSHEQMAMDIRNLLEAVLPIFDRSPSLLIAAAPTLVSILTLPPPPLRDAWGRVHSSDGLHTLTINMLYSCQPHALADACLHQLVDAAVASAKDPSTPLPKHVAAALCKPIGHCLQIPSAEMLGRAHLYLPAARSLLKAAHCPTSKPKCRDERNTSLSALVKACCLRALGAFVLLRMARQTGPSLTEFERSCRRSRRASRRLMPMRRWRTNQPPRRRSPRR